MPTFSFPGPILIGDGGDVMPMTPASLPTVLDLTRSGDRFVLADIRPSGGGYGEPEFVDPAGDPTPDSTQLLLSQFVVHAPDGVFSTFEDDGIPYISQSVQFGVGSRICFLNRFAAAAPPHLARYVSVLRLWTCMPRRFSRAPHSRPLHLAVSCAHA